MKVNFCIHTEGLNNIRDKLNQRATQAETILAYQVKKDTEPFVPARTLSLNNRTRVEGKSIVYPGPYARYLYYGKYMVDESGNGPRHYVDAQGNEVIRYPFGAKLHATDKDLVFSTAVHGQAQAHWFEASKAQNLEKWKRVAEEALKYGKILIRFV